MSLEATGARQGLSHTDGEIKNRLKVIGYNVLLPRNFEIKPVLEKSRVSSKAIQLNDISLSFDGKKNYEVKGHREEGYEIKRKRFYILALVQ